MSTSVPQMEDKVPVVRYVPTMVVVRLAAVAKLVICFLDIAVLVGPLLNIDQSYKMHVNMYMYV